MKSGRWLSVSGSFWLLYAILMFSAYGLLGPKLFEAVMQALPVVAQR